MHRMAERLEHLQGSAANEKPESRWLRCGVWDNYRMKKTTLGLDDEEDNVYDSYRYITYLTSGQKTNTKGSV